MAGLDSQRDLQLEINSLKSLRTWSIILVIVFFILIPVTGYAFYYAEVGQNPAVKSWQDGIMFALKQSTGADVSQANPVTGLGDAFAVALAVLDLLLFGFIVTIIVLSIEIRVKSLYKARRVGGTK